MASQCTIPHGKPVYYSSWQASVLFLMASQCIIPHGKPVYYSSWQASVLFLMASQCTIPHGKPYVLSSAAMAFSVYILELDNGSYYVGHTNNLKRRLYEHQEGIACDHTKKHPMKRLLWYENKSDRLSASNREREIKGWRRAKKERLWTESSSSP